MRRRSYGFTATRSGAGGGYSLFELMVTAGVIGLVAAIAYPAYTDFVERSRRSEALEALQNLATLQEQFYNDNKAYTGSLAVLGMSSTTANDHYQLSIATGPPVAGTIQSYTLSATAQGGQAGDTECATIQLDSNGTKVPSQCW